MRAASGGESRKVLRACKQACSGSGRFTTPARRLYNQGGRGGERGPACGPGAKRCGAGSGSARASGPQCTDTSPRKRSRCGRDSRRSSSRRRGSSPGIALAGIAGILDELVGLAVLIPAAIGMRGAIFGAMGSRLSTAIQTGLFSFSLRRGVLAENVQAAAVLSLVSGVFLAFLARYLSDILGVRTRALDRRLRRHLDRRRDHSRGALARASRSSWRLSVARGWDMDNIAAPP